METAKNRLRGCLLFLAFVITPFLFAQNGEESRTQVAKTEEGFILSQVIVFPDVPNASRYEVELEQLIGSEPVPAGKIETGVNKVDVALKSGNYRYRVTAFNKMGLVEGISEWQRFDILPAVEPVAETYQPFYGLFYELADTVGSITVTGSDFFAASEFALVRHNTNTDWSGKELENRKDVIIPDHVEVSENRAVLTFNRETLKRGKYDIFIRNPGGVWTILGQVRVGPRNDHDFTLSFGYSPMIAAFDIENSWEYKEGIRHQQLDRFNPLGYYFRFGWLPIKTKIGNFGLEAQFYFLVDKVLQSFWEDTGTGERFGSSFTSLTVNFLYQLPLERWQHNIRFGMGNGKKYHTYAEGPGSSRSGDGFYFNWGYSVQYFFWKNAYAEAGFDIQYVVQEQENAFHLMFRPGIGLGWQFGKWAEHAEVAEAAERGKDYSVPVKDIPRAEQFLSVSWAPMIPLYGMDLYGTCEDPGLVKQGQGNQYLQPINPGGFSIRYAYLPYRWGKNKLGMELELSFLEHKNRNTLIERDFWGGWTDILSQLLVGIRYQRVLTSRLQLNTRAAFGYANGYDYTEHYDMGSPKGFSSSAAFAFNAGASAQYFFRKNAYVEGGLDFTFLFMRKSGAYARPIIGLGWQFNRDNETGLRLPGTGLPESRPAKIVE